jgi:hypothetical protein
VLDLVSRTNGLGADGSAQAAEKTSLKLVTRNRVSSLMKSLVR